MSTFLNILWLICGGLVSALVYMLGGALCCLTIIGIPFGLQAFRIAAATLSPFGRTVTPDPDGDGVLATIFNIVWLLTAGFVLALSHLTHAAALAVTIVGLPFALQHLKLIPLCLMPFKYTLT